MSSTTPVSLEPIAAYKLNSIGIIKLDGNRATPSCQLYQQYFQHQQEQVTALQAYSTQKTVQQILWNEPFCLNAIES